jgi:hypothetical protein
VRSSRIIVPLHGQNGEAALRPSDQIAVFAAKPNRQRLRLNLRPAHDDSVSRLPSSHRRREFTQEPHRGEE